ncbi:MULTISPECIES: Na(+)/H(+) antiporter subunit C [unclassified Nosocomiicoccus]|uniref:Na(+)/H(+) antiporter subunit C n=1 Tax=unclassified Nosocomiicoccus TaxID=2646683 RepID=UPI0008A28C67|nr:MULTISPECIES: Na(+)/H(+) antiporter subunit C [unclassified Nosocomiicoccus]OFO52742.1 cation:proton antiporter [Nosocomiicoccus sp. HMSC059G07]OFS62666.1 cation:proton antiporter [Nosocomiicoccus sp. HMSC09A07]
MEFLMIILSGVLIGCATYLILSKGVLRIIIGISVLSHGVHLMLLTMGQLKRGNVPILDERVEVYTDPLPQAMILTAIVISFALTAYSLVLALNNYKVLGTDDTEDMKGRDDGY